MQRPMIKIKEGKSELQWETINCNHWHKSPTSGQIDLCRKLSHNCSTTGCTTGLWLHCMTRNDRRLWLLESVDKMSASEVVPSTWSMEIYSDLLEAFEINKNSFFFWSADSWWNVAISLWLGNEGSVYRIESFLQDLRSLRARHQLRKS